MVVNMSNKVKLTKALFEKGLSDRGSVSADQLRALGFSGFEKGWKKRAIGKYFNEGQVKEFIALKNIHLIRHQALSEQWKWKEAQKKKRVRNKKPKQKKEPVPRQKTNDKKYEKPEWKAKRIKILERDGYKCVSCGRGVVEGVQLQVHHLVYDNDLEMWEVPDWYLVTLCFRCHQKEHSKRLCAPKKHF